MSRLAWNYWAIAGLWTGIIGLIPGEAWSDLTKNQIQTLETEFLPAYNRGDNLQTLTSLAQVVRSMSDEQVAELDVHLATQNIPSSSQLLVTARLSLMRQNPDLRLPRASMTELLLALKHIDREIGTVLEAVAALRAELQRPASDRTFDDYETLFWNSHVLEQQLDSAAVMAHHAATSTRYKNRHAATDLTPAQRELLDADYGDLEQQLRLARLEAGEQEILARIKRLVHARNVLRDSRNLVDRFHAAWSIGLDGELVRKALKTNAEADPKTVFQNDLLNDAVLPLEVDHVIDQARELAGPELLLKSRHLFVGLHWWMRGRYGMGTDGYGLLKPEAAATRADAWFALYMPVVTPTPTNPQDASKYQIPEIDRRHNYIWAWEYRKIFMVSGSSRKATGGNKTFTQQVELSRFY